jgi:hypothetical protein
MQWAALVAWVATALGGLTLFLQWARHGGLGQREGIRAIRLVPHLALAAVGLCLWVAYIAADRRTLAWIAVGLLVVVALLGVSMLTVSLRGRTNIVRTEAPAEAIFPLPLVALHGALGATTLVLGALAAAGIGS